MFKKIPALFLGVTLCLPGVAPSQALEAPTVYRGVLILEGPIVAGDFDRLRQFLADKATFDKITGGVFTASPGGNMLEAIRIGKLIRALELSTVAPSGSSKGGRRFGETLIRPDNLHDARNYLCTSACFLVFISGVYRDLNWAGRLGVHKPFQVRNGVKIVSGDDVADAQVRRAMDSYLREMNVRIKYVDLMFSTPSAEVRWITQNELDADITGFIPELKDTAAARCTERATVNSTTPVKPVEDARQVRDASADAIAHRAARPRLAQGL